MWMNYYHYPGYYWGGILGPIISVFVVVFVILVIFRIFRPRRHGELMDRLREKGFGESPIDILKRRYAKGEITKKEFEEMKKDIK